MDKIDLNKDNNLGEMIKRLSPLNEIAENEFRYLSELERIFINHNIKDRVISKCNKEKDKDTINYIIDTKDLSDKSHYIFVDFKKYIDDIPEEINMYGTLEIGLIDNEEICEMTGIKYEENFNEKYTVYSKGYFIAESEDFLGKLIPRHFIEIDLNEEDLRNLDIIDEVYNDYLFELMY